MTQRNWDDPLDFKEEGIVIDYKTAGVDIDAGNAFAKSIPLASHGFGGMFQVPQGYEEPVLVSGADGVGTKLNICQIANDWTTIGIDLVAMCVNDVITCGAKPLYFLDYISTQRIDKNLPQMVEGILKGCEIAGIELLGGETAEHPRQLHYDMAGFCTGIVEKKKIINGKSIRPTDAVIGLASSGLHSNGYSLVNYLLTRHQIFYADHPELLTPTTIYAPVVKKLLEEIDDICGMAHITGGGIQENVDRIIPEGMTARIWDGSWTLPEIFKKIQLKGNVDMNEMKRVFNLGIGYCVVLPANRLEFAMDMIRNEGISCWEIGEVYNE
jgi:phosphoribosylformylglycinamidine cyclo-ligase|tara:strand:+ start:384 stop:1361 length:978 start_codon:yes stop_codon:yes gene_type:complete